MKKIALAVLAVAWTGCSEASMNQMTDFDAGVIGSPDASKSVPGGPAVEGTTLEEVAAQAALNPEARYGIEIWGYRVYDRYAYSTKAALPNEARFLYAAWDSQPDGCDGLPDIAMGDLNDGPATHYGPVDTSAVPAGTEPLYVLTGADGAGYGALELYDVELAIYDNDVDVGPEACPDTFSDPSVVPQRIVAVVANHRTDVVVPGTGTAWPYGDLILPETSAHTVTGWMTEEAITSSLAGTVVSAEVAGPYHAAYFGKTPLWTCSLSEDESGVEVLYRIVEL